jgi:hypothetical protein
MFPRKLFSVKWALPILLFAESAHADMITITPTGFNVAGGTYQNLPGGIILGNEPAYFIVDHDGSGTFSTPNEGLLNFNLASVHSRVNNATLMLFQIGASGAQSQVYNLYENTSPWTGQPVSWNARPTRCLPELGCHVAGQRLAFQRFSKLRVDPCQG